MATPVEVKRLITIAALPTLRDRLDLGEPKRREIWFFDQDPPQLATAGAILRLRRGPKSEELTVKLRGRPLPGDLAELFEGEGFKVELDCSGGDDGRVQVTPATSLTLENLPREDGRPAAGASLRGRLDRKQRALLALGAGEVDWAALVAYGPIRSEAWKWEEGGLGFEAWEVGGERILEVSRRGAFNPEDGDTELRAQLHAWGVSAEGLPGGKTAWAIARARGA